MSQPDLFVVCKNCGSEVSPYVTECPYCGQRVRKRAPKIDKPGDPEAAPRRRRRKAGTRLPRLRPDEIEGIAPDVRPYGTLTLIVASLATTIVFAGSKLDEIDMGGIALGIQDDVWRYFAAPFVHGQSLGYQFVALVAVGVFGTLLERRFGLLPVVLVFVLAGAAGCAAAVAVDFSGPYNEHLVWGANGAALGVLCAWLVDDRRAARRGIDRENDLIGVYVFAVVLLLLSLAVAEANIVAGVTGAAAGALAGLALPLFARR